MSVKLNNFIQYKLDKIRDKTISMNELNYELEKLYTHIAGNRLASLNNYSEKTIIDAIIEHYPDKIDVYELKAKTQEKINDFMRCLYETIFIEKERISVNPLILKAILNHIKGIDEDGEKSNQPQYVIQNYIESNGQGEAVQPEKKT